MSWKVGDKIKVKPVDWLTPKACKGVVIKKDGKSWVRRSYFMDVPLECFERWGEVCLVHENTN